MLVAIVALAAALGAYRLGYKSLWLDEVTYVRSAQMGGLFGPYGLASISHPPGYLFIMRLMGSISHEEWLLRLPALIASALGIVAAWGLGRALVGRVEGLLVAFMLALSALRLEYAQEAHSYALFATLSTFWLWSLYWIAQRSVGQFGKLRPGGQLPAPSAKLRTLGPWAVAVLLATADLYVHYYALVPVALSLIVFPCFLLVVQPGPVASLWREPAKRRALLNLAIALIIIGLLFSPQLFSQLLGSARVAADRTQALEAGTLAASFDLNPSLLSETLLAFITNRTPWTADPLFVSAVVGLWCVGLAWLVWRRRAVSVALLAWMLLPLPLVAWFAFQTGISFAPRRLIFILPVFLLMVATGVTTLGRLAAWAARRLAPGRPELARWASWASIVLVTLAFVKGSVDPITSYFARPKQDWKGLATILRTLPQPEDAIVVLPNASGPLEWYFPGPHNVIAKDLVPKLQTLCEKSPAVYVAVAGTGGRLSESEADWLVQNYIQIPLKDLRLYYRNCRPDVWYGEGAEQIFELARHPGLTLPVVAKSLSDYQILAAQQQAIPPSPTPTPLPTSESPATPTLTAVTPTERAPTATLSPTLKPTPGTTVDLPDPSAGLADLLTTLADKNDGPAIRQVWQGAYQARTGTQDEANRYFEAAIEQAPDDWVAYALLASSLANIGQSDQALEVIARGLQAIPDSPSLVEQQKRLQGETSEAPPGLRDVLDNGRSALRDEDWSAGIAAGQQAVSLAPDRSEAHLLLGDAYRASGELSQALSSYQRATELAPQVSLYHSRQSEVLVRQGQPENALDLALLALAIEDSRWENWLALGRALAALSQNDLGYRAWAEHALQVSMDLAPEGNQAPARALAELSASLPAQTTTSETQPAPTETDEVQTDLP